jgi:hypothetical protein
METEGWLITSKDPVSDPNSEVYEPRQYHHIHIVSLYDQAPYYKDMGLSKRGDQS